MPLKKEVAEQIHAAFDYRGHVTVTFVNGERLEGYLYNRALDAREPFVEMFPLNSDERRRIAAETIASVALTGKDFAVPFTPPAKG